jgi:hypothetical protein
VARPSFFRPNASRRYVRRYVVNRSEVDEARKIRREFHDREPDQEIEVDWEWPKTMRHLGECVAVMYASDKWQERRGNRIDYKHVAEGPQQCFVADDFPVLVGSRELDQGGEQVSLGKMPRHFALLDKILGVQVRLSGSDEDDGYYQIDIPRAKLGAMRTSDGLFLLVYTDDGVHMIITGDQLGVTKDGIIG